MNKSDGHDDVRARFDLKAADWDANPVRVALAHGVVEAIRAAVPLRSDMQALDFGAGTGLVTVGLSPHVGSLLAVDSSGEMMRTLDTKLRASQIGNIRTRVGDVGAAALPAGAFDLVVSSMTLHHIPDVPAVLRRLRPCLRRGGWIALADLDAEDGTFHADLMGVFHKGLAREDLLRWLRDAGFTECAVREAHRVARTPADGIPREYPVFLATGRAG